ncbi:MAG TPA: hypothetical protein PKG60_06275 [Spirochaetota bacterium]|nr:hypothetical protein [Spirochaetota bacterium]HPS85596.1 hypothetical protein [Spirochaetota bacterium]
MKFILKMKHWQLFLLLFILPTIMGLLEFGFIYRTFIFVVGFMLWLVVTGFLLFDEIKLNATRNKLIISFLSIIGLSNYFLNYILKDYKVIINNNYKIFFDFYNYLALAIFFVMIIIIANALATVELKRNVKFNDYKKEIILLWLFPVGVWIIQPRINSIFKSSSTV